MILGLLGIPEGLQNIREYLDQDGAILSGHQEFITYFALPFVAEPHLHPSFKHLFEVSLTFLLVNFIFYIIQYILYLLYEKKYISRIR